MTMTNPLEYDPELQYSLSRYTTGLEKSLESFSQLELALPFSSSETQGRLR